MLTDEDGDADLGRIGGEAVAGAGGVTGLIVEFTEPGLLSNRPVERAFRPVPFLWGDDANAIPRYRIQIATQSSDEKPAESCRLNLSSGKGGQCLPLSLQTKCSMLK